MDSRIEIDIEIAKEIFKLAQVPIPEKITDETLLSSIVKIKENKKQESKKAQNEQKDPLSIDSMDFPNINTDSIDNSNDSILIIDDIGIVTYQLKVMFSNLGYNVQVAKDIFSGLNIFIKSNSKFVIMDLFVSTEQEGYTLLHETKKIIVKNNLNTKIIVITASNKAENKVKCINGGADYFLKKDAGWQDKLVKLVVNPDEVTE